jgi:hypothetical protein
MNRPPPRETNSSPASANQHAEWLREEIEELLDAVFRAYGGTKLDEGEIARLRNEIEGREEVLARYRMLGLLQ